MSYRFCFPMVCLTAMLMAVAPHVLEAKGGCMPGTYLVVQDDGTQSLWTFSADGTLHITSSAEAALGFSHEQGIWESKGARRAEAVTLDFNFALAAPAGGVPPAEIARVDARVAFSKTCRSLSGSFELRFFDIDTEDPLDPATDLGDGIPGVFAGRRLTLPQH